MPTLTSRNFPATRMRRLRQKPFIRDLVRETALSTKDLILPLFVKEGEDEREAIEAMPGTYRLGINPLLEEARRARDLGISAIALFPVIDAKLKSPDGKEAHNPKGLIPRTVERLKEEMPELGIITDVALDPYTDHGQDGVIDKHGEVLNDETLAVLCEQAATHAGAGADIVAPSDMMDGRVGAIRKRLDKNGHEDTIILAYSAKYASGYYYPFRDALGSQSSLAGADKKSYQMDVGNSDEALHECALDINEGADIVMVKPGMPCLDVIYKVKHQLKVPTFAYQVSGEYAMHALAFEHNCLPRETVLLESLMALKRAGADAILSYFALQAAEQLRGHR